MNEFETRLAWVLGAVVLAVGAVLILRKLAGRRSPVRIRQTTLDAGVYLFTSATCADCETARQMLVGALGSSGFVELSWESAQGAFRDLGINAVPATLIVGEAGGALLYPGRPDQALEGLGP
ncbi:MAG: hypothetical protein M3P87_10245 [Actinomycetota bacterium]|nr:hypothetical protein [Actinomycetota bacterium]